MISGLGLFGGEIRGEVERSRDHIGSSSEVLFIYISDGWMDRRDGATTTTTTTATTTTGQSIGWRLEMDGATGWSDDDDDDGDDEMDGSTGWSDDDDDWTIDRMATRVSLIYSVMKPKLLYLVLFILINYSKNDEKRYEIDIDQIQSEDVAETRSRIIMIDGNMFVVAGANGNITLSRSTGGNIFINDFDVAKTIHFATFTDYETRLVHLKTTSDFIKRQYIHFFEEVNTLRTKIDDVQYQQYSLIETYSELLKSKKNRSQISESFSTELESLKETMTKLHLKLNSNACGTHQCSNGGICVPRAGEQFYCLCTAHFSGEKCEDLIDECGEIHPCQNNGTCMNTREGFVCNCINGYHGPHCEYYQNACSTNSQLCGPHGRCIPTIDSYDCHCHAGFKKSNSYENPICVDVDECMTNPCHPGVECINLDGTYQCFGCPDGFKMGHNGCIDINECEEDNYCDPEVECTNLIGSYECGDCPNGYTGDSKTGCKKENVCQPWPCGRHTVCSANDHFMNMNGYICGCNNGEIYDEDKEECVPKKNGVCSDETCFNGGTCNVINEYNYTCHCPKTHFGDRCEKLSPCDWNMCYHGDCVFENEEIYHCKCDKSYYGAYCEYHETLFNEHFTELSGSFRFNSSAFSTKNMQQTFVKNTYFYISEPSSILKITFTKFQDFSDITSNCSESQPSLKLYDGPNEQFPLFNTYCGGKINEHFLNQTITMTSTYAFLKFNGSFGYYEGYYQVVPRTCGYRTSKPDGRLVVPQNEQDMFCEWFISAPADKLIQITIPAINLYSGDQIDCDQNKLDVYDGISVLESTLIVELCSNSEQVKTYRSTGPYLSVSFKNNILSSSTNISKIAGFSIGYQFVESTSHCGFDIDNVNQVTGLTGYIESPNYGSLYPPNTRCTWNIYGAGKNNKRHDIAIIFEFEAIDIKSSAEKDNRTYDYEHSSSSRYQEYMKCTSDRLRFFNMRSYKIHDICNGNYPATNKMIVKSSNVVITFQSNETVQGRGFRLKYEVRCVRFITGNATVETWNYPNGGVAGTCSYIIQPESTHMIYITFTSVLVETDCSTETKPTNYVSLTGGHGENHPIRKLYTCRNNEFMENQTLSVHASRKLTITVSSDGTDKFKGIAFDVHTVDIKCGGLFTPPFTFASPNYPQNYPTHMKCKYAVKSNIWAIQTFKIEFEDFDLAENLTRTNLECENETDRLEIVSRSEEKREKLSLCGSRNQAPIIIKAHGLDFVFYSGNSSSGGFKATVTKIAEENPSCDQTFHTSTGEIVFSPTEYPFESCVYTITVEDNQQIIMNVNEMNIPCETSQLNFYDGIQNKKQFEKLCGDRKGISMKSFANKATIIFNTTSPMISSFKISYKVQYGCGSSIDSYAGLISAPQFPFKENREVDCQWRITVAHGNRVELTLVHDDLNPNYKNSTNKCPENANSLEITEIVSGNIETLGKFCDENMNMYLFTSQTNQIRLRYIQHKALNQKVSGFSASFKTSCQNDVFGSSGVIQSPGYPYDVDFKTSCSWRITAPIGNRIVVNFQEFIVNRNRMENTLCTLFDNRFSIEDTFLWNATVNTYNGIKSGTYAKFCDLNIPSEIRSRHNILEMSYVSKEQRKNKFMLYYYTAGCVDEINYPQNIIIKREDIDIEYHDEFECQYTITAPVGQRIKLIIDSFDVQHNLGCEYHPQESFKGMKIFMGSSNSSGHASRVICAVTSRSEYEMHTNQIFVQMKLGNSFKRSQQIFLNASVVFHERKDGDFDGEVVDLSEQRHYTITSPNYPLAYPSLSRNNWIIKAAPGHHIVAEVISFNPPSGNGIDMDCEQVANQTGIIRMHDLDVFYMLGITRVNVCEKKEGNSYKMRDNVNVVFEGAEIDPSDKNKKIGFALKFRQLCGNDLFITKNKEKTMKITIEANSTCQINIRLDELAIRGVYASIESYHIKNGSIVHESIGNGVLVRAAENYNKISSTNMYYSLYGFNIEFEAKNYERFSVIRYGNPQCGGDLTQEQSLFHTTVHNSLDCVWKLGNTLGNKVSISFKGENFPGTGKCSDSYLEVRQSNALGNVLFRGCGSALDEERIIEEPSLYIHLKHQQSIQRMAATRYIHREFTMRMKKIAGGRADSNILLPPIIDSPKHFTWHIPGRKEHWKTQVTTSEVSLSKNSYITFKQSNDADEVNAVITRKLTGFPDDATFILPYDEGDIEVCMSPGDDFKIELKSVPENTNLNYFEERKKKREKKSREEWLTPTWEWQTISNPLPANQTTGYHEKLYYTWSFNRQPFNGMEFQFEKISLGRRGCAIVDFDINGRPYPPICSPDFLNKVYQFSNKEDVKVQFTTQESRGFTLKYRLKCGSETETMLPNDAGIYTLSNPPFRSGDDNINCTWHIKSPSNRKLSIEVPKVDMAYCEGDNSLTIKDAFYHDIKLCEKLSDVTRYYIARSSSLIVNYQSSTDDNKGFVMKIREQLVECPGETIRIDEENPSREVYSPEYPSPIPHSTECQYIIAAPNGHRIMLTFDHDHFNMQEPPEAELADYLEVRDGNSEKSPLIGRYSGKTPPSTIYSKANFMFMRLHTDNENSSRLFIAKFEIARCGGTLVLGEENKEYVLTSPDYPNFTTKSATCEWTVRTKNMHMIMVKVEHIWNNEVEKICNGTYFAILDGNVTMFSRNSCDNLQTDLMSFTRSSSSQIKVIYDTQKLNEKLTESECNKGKCGFKIVLKMSEISCGGDIVDDEGVITAPGYPNTLLPNVKCVWNFKAGPGFVWSFKIHFLDNDNQISKSEWSCFTDLRIIDSVQLWKFYTSFFCHSSVEEESLTDNVQVTYEDQHSREAILFGHIFEKLNVPFELSYYKIDAKTSEKACSYLVTEDSTWKFEFENETSVSAFRGLCHLSIQKLEQYQQIRIKILRFTSDSTETYCSRKNNHIFLETADYSRTICGANFERRSENDMLFTEDRVDFYIIGYDKTPLGLEFEISFQACGGHITEPMFSQISSSKEGPCRWLLEAPTGQVVQIEIIEMNCKHGKLTIGEGKEFELNVLHTYCQNGEIDEHFRTITSKSKYMSIVWQPGSVHAKSWKLNYEFVNEQETCGNIQKGLFGFVHSRNYSHAPYLPDQTCTWLIEVPTGYRIILNFKYFDIEHSENCTKDGLYLTEYYTAEDGYGKSSSPLCGHDLPQNYISERRVLKIVFKTDKDINGKGFALQWNAVCGGTFYSSEGVITSPNYPISYTIWRDCEYLVKMKPDDLTELTFEDMDFSKKKPSYQYMYAKPVDQNEKCQKNYVRIKQEQDGGTVSPKICNSSDISNHHLTVKGPFKIQFHNQHSWEIKHDRGFKLRYRKTECGGNIELTEFTTLSVKIERPRVGTSSMKCVWNITTNSNRELSTTFVRLNTANDGERDYVKLFDSLETDKPFGWFYGTYTTPPDSIRIKRSTLRIEMVYTYTSDEFLTLESGVKLIVESKPGGCRQNLDVVFYTKYLVFPNSITDGYPAGTYCEWFFNPFFGDFPIKLHLYYFDVDQTEGCPYDQLSIYHGSESSSNFVLQDVCKLDVVPRNFTFDKPVFIRFKSERGGKTAGFKFSYEYI